ncbi:cytochrome c [Sphingomonas sp. NFR15]|uniref:c-type cytochrome n=1 Tax=Sphingomonas sp. NFR15 TaxID=1566282 RepID=UPI00115FFC0F|nr:cytochrome c [Sphingomonas sp. NFR15]
MRRLLYFSPAALLLALTACEKEARVIAADQPQTSPRGPQDPRAAAYENNAYQVSQGGRYFSWYGCGRCHASGSRGDLASAGARRDLPHLYASIAHGHTSGARIPPEQIWQLAGYIRSLPRIDPARRKRQDRDLRGEPQGPTWTGALR